MKLPTSQHYQQAFQDTPKTIQALLHKENAPVISKIKTHYSISAQNASRIARTTALILVGLIPLKKFITELQEYAGLNQETARKVAYDIRDEIFAPVAKELAEMQTRIPEIQKAAELTAQRAELEARTRQQYLALEEEKLEAAPTLPDESVTRQLPGEPPIARRLPHIEKPKLQPSTSSDAAAATPPTPKPQQPSAPIEPPIPEKPVAPAKPLKTLAPLRQAPSSSAGKQDKPLTPPAPKKPTGPPIPLPQEPSQTPPPQQAPAPEPSARDGTGGAGQARQGPPPPKNLPI